MKRFLRALILSTFSFALFVPIFTTTVSAASNTNAFYFEDAVFDYYLEKAEDGTSKLHVKETLTAIFPDTNQNHGITRAIPYTNQGGENLTVQSKDALNFKVQRNGKNEPVAKTEESDGAYIFYIGDKNTYVHGRQVYTLTYDFTNVITQFTKEVTDQPNCIQAPCPAQTTTRTFQELYWDTNGTGWSQTFEKLTANLHLSRDIAKNVISGTSCYVGRYGSSNQSRCKITSSDESSYDLFSGIADSAISTENPGETVITFTADNLKAGENLTFAVDFQADTFVVKAPIKSPLAIIAAVVHILLVIASFGFVIYQYNKKNGEKKSYYKGLFVAPQYQPYKDITVAEAEAVSVSHVKDSKVATLLELAINKKIQIIKTEKTGILKKNSWKIKLLDDKNLTKSQADVIKLLRGGTMPDIDEEFEVKSQTYSSELVRIKRNYSTSAISSMKEKGYLEQKSAGTGYCYVPTIYLFVSMFVISFLLVTVLSPASKYLYYDECFFTMYATSIVCFPLSIVFVAKLKDYTKYTTAGLDLSNYYQGLKLYIKMAEKDRLKFLQSVKGVDTSDKGVVKLYEKLLPYACLFGEEESWMNELNKYYERITDYEHDWYSGTDFISGYMLGSMISSTNSSISSGTVSSGGGSSSSSGGGGGGFSGGGGGGGGGGGW